MKIIIRNENELTSNIACYKEMNLAGHTTLEECKRLISNSCKTHMQKNGFDCPDNDLFIEVMKDWDKCHWFEPVRIYKPGKLLELEYTVLYKGTFKG